MPGREHRFVGELARRLPASSQALIGDDAAVVDGMVVSVDSLVEGVDFLVGWGTPADIGWKSLAVAVSDLAAMAARPLTAVVAVVIGNEGEAFWTGVYEGLAEAADAFEVTVAGGDVSAGPVVGIIVTVLGRPGPRTLFRTGGRVGDLLYVGGPLGAAAAGLAGLQGRGPRVDHWERSFLRPVPQVAQALEAAEAGATAMLDVSDGLSTDALRLAHASGVDVELNAAWIPMAGGLDDVSLALSGGEDFVVCFSLPPERAAPAWAAPVGRLIPSGEGSRLLRPDGSTVPLEATGWDHLA